jgi:hypothetical protein
MPRAKHAACCSVTLEQIKDELLNGRDLSKKDNRKRQLELRRADGREGLPKRVVRR